jgi:hypothetical protein
VRAALLGLTQGSRVLALPGTPVSARSFSAARMIVIDEAARARFSAVGG